MLESRWIFYVITNESKSKGNFKYQENLSEVYTQYVKVQIDESTIDVRKFQDLNGWSWQYVINYERENMISLITYFLWVFR